MIEVRLGDSLKARKFFVRLFVLVLLLSGLRNATFAQVSASIQGTITDASGAVIAGAKVVVRNSALGIERNVASNSEGYYEVPALPPGSYSVEVRMQGFQHALSKDVILEVSQNAVQNFSLQIASSDTIITVESTQAAIESTTMTVGQVINNNAVQEIPLNGRHFVDLASLVPGTVVPPVQNAFLTSPLRGQGAFAIVTAGNREDTTNFQINGINLNDMANGQITFQPSINTVSEFKIDNSTYSAEYGRSSGSIVNIATRSGTNEFHGEAFEFLRNEKLDARNFFERTTKPAAFHRNQFGFNIGGPVNLPHFGEGGSPLSYHGKNKTFFFFSYEGLRQRQGLTLPIVTVPTDAQRAAVTDPAILKLLPLIPRSASGLTSGSATAPVNIDQWTGDVSHNFSSKDRLHGYYAFQRDLRGEPILQGNNIPGFGDTRQSHRQIFTLNETRTFGANLVNEARFGFNRIHIIFSPNAKLNPLDFNIKDGVTEAIGLP